MIITECDVRPCALRKEDPKWATSLHANPLAEGLIVRIATKNGQHGVGYASAVPHMGSVVPVLKAELEFLSQALLGPDARHVETVALLRDDVVMSMPPYDFWLSGPDELAKWFVGPGIGCEGSRLIPVEANGMAAYASYKPDPAGGHAPWSIQVIEVSGDRIVGHHNFLDTNLFAFFGLPAHL